MAGDRANSGESLVGAATQAQFGECATTIELPAAVKSSLSWANRRPRMLACRLSGQRKFIRAERRGGQSFLVPEIARRIIGPAISDRRGLGHFGMPDFN